MIYKSLELIRQNLEDYLALNLTGEDTDLVALDNIALFDKLREAEVPGPSVIMSLVNIEEEASLKNNALYRTAKSNQAIDYHSAPLFINLHLLISANHEDYSEALQNLSLVLQYFQGKKHFSISNSFDSARELGGGEELTFSDNEEAELKMNIELFSMSFEQVNHLWGSLGGRQVPFALYIVRIVRVEDKFKQKSGAQISQVLINEK